MKIPTIRPVRSLALDTIFKPSRNKTRRGLTRFVSKLDEITGANRVSPFKKTYNVLTKKMEVVNNQRITRIKSKGKNKFHAVGFGEFLGSFAEFKTALKSAGYTGFIYFGKKQEI